MPRERPDRYNGGYGEEEREVREGRENKYFKGDMRNKGYR